MKYVILCCLVIFMGCVKEIQETPEEIPPTAELPTVTTTAISDITTNSAKTGGNITNDGGSDITVRGIVYAVMPNPTINDNKITSGSGDGAFDVELTGLEVNTEYHVRAYATNEKGTAYGNDLSFITKQESTPDTIMVEQCELLRMPEFTDFSFEKGFLHFDNEIANFQKVVSSDLKRVTTLWFTYIAANDFEITELNFTFQEGDTTNRPASMQGITKRYNVREFDTTAEIGGQMIYDLIEEVPVETTDLFFNDSGFIEKMDFGTTAVEFKYENGRLVSVGNTANSLGGSSLVYNESGDLMEVYATDENGNMNPDPSVRFVYSNERVQIASYIPFTVFLPEEADHPTFGRVQYNNPANFPIVLTQILNWAPLRPKHALTQMIWPGVRNEEATHYFTNQEIDENGKLRYYDVASNGNGDKIGAVQHDWGCWEEQVIVD